MTPPRNRQPGELERGVLAVLWRSDRSLTANEIRIAVGEPHPALTTMLTVLDRLGAKGLVARNQQGGVLHFNPAVSESDHTATAMLNALESSDDRGAALVRFAGDLSAAEVDVLRAALNRRSS